MKSCSVVKLVVVLFVMLLAILSVAGTPEDTSDVDVNVSAKTEVTITLPINDRTARFNKCITLSLTEEQARNLLYQLTANSAPN